MPPLRLIAALLAQFEQRMARRDEVMACYEASGELDFLVIAVTASARANFRAWIESKSTS